MELRGVNIRMGISKQRGADVNLGMSERQGDVRRESCTNTLLGVDIHRYMRQLLVDRKKVACIAFVLLSACLGLTL